MKDSQEILHSIVHKLKQHGINHVTIQLESKEHDHPETIICKD